MVSTSVAVTALPHGSIAPIVLRNALPEASLYATRCIRFLARPASPSFQRN
jgi:hypothetical protein